MHRGAAFRLPESAVLVLCCLVLASICASWAGAALSLSSTLAPYPGSVELTEKRTAFSKTYANPNGTRTWVSGAGDQPMHYRDASGAWQEIDVTIQRTTIPRGYGYAVTANTFHAYFVDRLSTGALAKFQMGNTWVRYSVADSFQPSNPKVEGRVITYPEVFPETDIRYCLREGMAKQEIVLHRFTGRSEFRFKLETHGLTPKLVKDGSIRFVNAAGEQKWYMPRPEMWDSSNEDTVSYAVTARLENNESDTYLVLKADEGWLTDPSRVYPVYVDPTWGGYNDPIYGQMFPTADTWISSATPDTNVHAVVTKAIRIGGGGDPLLATNGIARAMLKWDMTTAPAQADVVNSADSCRVRLYVHGGGTTTTDVSMHKITTAWDETTTWNQFNAGNGFNPTALAVTSVGATGTDYYWSYNASTAGQGMPAADGLLFKFVNETATYYKNARDRTATDTDGGLFTRRPWLAIDYGVSAPATPTSLVNTSDFTTFADGSSSWNAVGTATSYDVALGTTPGGEEMGITNLTGTTKTWTGLTNGATYYVKVRAKNAIGDSPWSNPVPMTMALIIESHPAGYRNGTYSDINLTSGGSKSIAAGLKAAQSQSQINTGPGSNGAAIFTPAYAIPGYYEVFVTWPSANMVNTINARYAITHLDGTTVLYRDQLKSSGDVWHSLGYYRFNADGTGNVVTDNSETTTSDGSSKFFADALKFVYIPGVPAPMNLRNTTDYTTLTSGSSTWDPVAGATGYDIALGTTRGGEEVLPPTSVTGTSYNWSGLAPGVTYYVKLRSKSAADTGAWGTAIPMTMGIIIEAVNGYESGWYSDFTMTDVATKSTAAGLIGTGSRYQLNSGFGSPGQASFSPVFGKAGYYEVFITWPTANLAQTENARYSITHANGTSTAYLNQFGQYNGSKWHSVGRYYFNAGSGQSVQADHYETTSTSSRFYVDAVKFSPISGVAAPNNLVNTTDYTTMTGGTSTWDAVPGATSYDIALGITPGGEEISVTNQTGTSKTWSGLTAGMTYYVKLRSNGAAGTGAWGLSVPLNMAIVIESGNNGSNFSWYSDANLTSSGNKSTTPGLTATYNRHQPNVGAGSNGQATFAPTISKAGVYEVFATWPAWSTVETLNTKFTITHSGGSTIVYRDMVQANGGQWISLGQFQFGTGSSQYVVMDNSETTSVEASPNFRRFFADAMKFVPMPTFTTPTGFVKPGRWNLVSVPADPINADPLAVFSGVDVANASFQFWKNNTDGGGFQSYGEMFGWTGPITRGTPYWFLEATATQEKTIGFDAWLPTADFELTVSGHTAAPFWIMFGTPFVSPVMASNIQFKNVAKRGDTWLSWTDAFSETDPLLRIVDSNAQGWDAAQNRFVSVVPPPFLGESDKCLPWWGYWLLVYDAGDLIIKFPKPY